MAYSHFSSYYLCVSGIIWVGFAIIGFGCSRVFKRYDVADLFWSACICLTPVLLIGLLGSEINFKGRYLFVLLFLWGIRLFSYMGLRMCGSQEDRRYTAWRHEWGRNELWRSFLQIFCLQPLFLLVLVAPLSYAIVGNDSSWSVVDFLGMVVFTCGLLFETVADAQLYQFKKLAGSKGRVMNRGLWSLSQHPNYLGEMLVWVGFSLLAFDTAGWWAVVSPILIIYVLMELTGIKMKKRFMHDYRGLSFYQRTVPVLVPHQRLFLRRFITALIVLLVIDGLWLKLAGNFYWAQMQHLARVENGSWDIIPWGFIGCYIGMAFGVVYFCVSKYVWQSLFQGAIFGLVAYGIYDLVNLTLLQGWSMEMVMVDVLWGTVLCGMTACVVSRLSQKPRHSKRQMKRPSPNMN